MAIIFHGMGKFIAYVDNERSKRLEDAPRQDW
jgi:hypothetical protein